MVSEMESTKRSPMDWFFVSTDGTRARRPADIVIGIFGALVVFVTAAKSDQFAWLEELFSQFVEQLHARRRGRATGNCRR